MAELDEKLAAMMADPKHHGPGGRHGEKPGHGPAGSRRNAAGGTAEAAGRAGRPEAPAQGPEKPLRPTLAGCFAAVGRYGWPERPGREPPKIIARTAALRPAGSAGPAGKCHADRPAGRSRHGHAGRRRPCITATFPRVTAPTAGWTGHRNRPHPRLLLRVRQGPPLAPPDRPQRPPMGPPPGPLGTF